MKNNIVIDISPPIPYLAQFWFSSYGSKCCQSNQIAEFFTMEYLKKELNELDFWHADKH